MSHTALVKVAPIFTLERFNDPTWARPGRTLYESGALQFLPGRDSIPLLVDHDDSREIGTVHELFKMDWTDGPWICARATVNAPPSWLKTGTRASFGFATLHRRELSLRDAEAEIMAKALMTEVSVLGPGVPPAEPCAEVLSYRPAEAPKRSAVAEIPLPLLVGRVARPDPEIEELNRRIDWAERTGRRVDVGLLVENMQRELSRWPVLGVR